MVCWVGQTCGLGKRNILLPTGHLVAPYNKSVQARNPRNTEPPARDKSPTLSAQRVGGSNFGDITMIKSMTSTQRSKLAIAEETHSAFISCARDCDDCYLAIDAMVNLGLTADDHTFQSEPRRKIMVYRVPGELGRERIRAAIAHIKTAKLLKTAWW